MTHGAAGVKGSRHGYPGSLSDGMADVGIEMGRHTWSLR